MRISVEEFRDFFALCDFVCKLTTNLFTRETILGFENWRNVYDCIWKIGRSISWTTVIMPFAMKIQPIDSQTAEESFFYSEPVKPVVKSRLKGLFERQFLNNSAAEKAGFVVEEPPPLHFSKDNCNGGGSADFEPSSVCLAKMVQNFIEENNEKQQSSAVRCGRSRCNGFNGSCSDSSEDELDSYFGDTNLASSGETYEILKVQKENKS